MAGQEEQVMVFAAINVWLTKGNSRFTMPPPRAVPAYIRDEKSQKEEEFRGCKNFARIIEFSIFQRQAGILLTTPSLQVN